MDGRSWLWRRKLPEKNTLETDSSGTMSSQSDESTDDHNDREELRNFPNHASRSHVQPSKNLSKFAESEGQETVESLTKKLSAALTSINAKEESVKQHVKVAEEAVSGWEKAEIEVTILKQHLEAAAHKNSALEDQVAHLSEALQEQRRQIKEEEEQKYHEAITKNSSEWESEKLKLENQLIELQIQLESSNSSINGLIQKLEDLEKENSALTSELRAKSKDLEIQILERDLGIQLAETASKQHLESIKKITQLEAECLMLRAAAHKSSISSENHSTNGEKILNVDNEPHFSDSWASALLSELGQFKNDKASSRNLNASMEIELLDDFLEMEKLASLPPETNSGKHVVLDGQTRISELEEKIKMLENQKEELEIALADTKFHLEDSYNQLMLTENKLLQLENHLELVNKSKQEDANMIMIMKENLDESEANLKSAKLEIEKLCEMADLLERKFQEERTHSAELEEMRKKLESQIELAGIEIKKLQEKVGFLEAKVEEERALSAENSLKIEALEATRKVLESQLESSHLDAWELRDKVGPLEKKLEEEKRKRKEFEVQLESVNQELVELQRKVTILEQNVEEERTSANTFAVKCRELEVELSEIKQAAELRIVTSSCTELKMKQEKELAAAADKFAECQKTIASLGRQLKALSNLDDFVALDTLLPELGGDLSGYSTIPNVTVYGERRALPLSSSFSGFTKLLSQSRNRTENQL